MRPWIYLLIASICEIGWAIGMKYSAGWTRLWPSAFTVVAMILSVVFLSLAIKHIPLGTAYALWTGIGAAGTAIAGILLFSESAHPARLISILIIAAGIIALKLSSRA